MPAMAPIPPLLFKELMEREGWRVIDQDEFHWILEHPSFDEPCLIPKDTELVAVDLMMSLFRRAAWTLKTYLEVVRVSDLEKPFVN